MTDFAVLGQRQVTLGVPTSQAPSSGGTGGDSYKGAILLQESFTDNNLTSRGWYDCSNTQFVIDGGTLKLDWVTTGTTPAGWGDARHKFTATESLYFSFNIKTSSNWVGSNHTYHPHLFYICTDVDTDYLGYADSHMTCYVEPHSNLYFWFGIQDRLNIDTNNINVDLTGTTENRAVAGCNGTKGDAGNYVGCYNYSAWRNERWWYPPNAITNPTSFHKVEVYLKMNSISGGKGLADGVAIMWVDGTEIMHNNAMVFRTGAHPIMKFNQIGLGPYIGDGSPVAQTLWLDDITLAQGLSGSGSSNNAITYAVKYLVNGTDYTGRTVTASSQYQALGGVSGWDINSDSLNSYIFGIGTDQLLSSLLPPGALTTDGAGNWALQIPANKIMAAGTYDVVATEVDASNIQRSDATTNELVIQDTSGGGGGGGGGEPPYSGTGTPTTLPPDAYWVDQNHPNASDLNPGTEALPWRTFVKAMQTATPGETVGVKAGTYLGADAAWSDVVFNPTNSGTANNYIRFQAKPGDKVILKSSGGASQGGIIGGNGRSYIWWEGFDVQNAGTRGVAFFNGASHNVVRNCYVHGMRSGDTSNTPAVEFTDSYNNIVEYCELYDTANSGTENATCFTFFHGTDNILRYNKCHNSATGIMSKSNANEGDARNEVYRNYFYNLTHPIHMILGGTGTSPMSSYNKYYENLIVSSGSASIQYMIAKYHEYNNLWNNTVINNASSSATWQPNGYATDAPPTYTNHVSCYNNIFIQQAAGGPVMRTYYENPPHTGEFDIHDYNCFFNTNGSTTWSIGYYGSPSNLTFAQWQALGYDIHGMSTNPLFVNLTGGDYHLTTASPCKGAGRVGGLVTGAAMDMGCFANADWLADAGVHGY